MNRCGSRVTDKINGLDRNFQRQSSRSIAWDGMRLALDQVGLQIRLRVTDSVVSSLHNGHFVVCFIVFGIHAHGPVKGNKQVGTCAGLDPEDDVASVRVIGAEICHSNHGTSPRLTVRGWVQCLEVVIVPSNLIVLGTVEAHLSNFIGIKWVSLLSEKVKIIKELEHVELRLTFGGSIGGWLLVG
jgi:hypothetical protein